MFNDLILFAVGLAGILTVNLIEIDALNQQDGASTNLKKYISKHWANMMLSVVMVGVAVVSKQYVADLEAAGKSIFIGIFAIGMVGPTAAQFIRSKALAFFKTKTPPAE